MKLLALIFCATYLFSQTAQVQIIHNSPYPTVDIYVDGTVALTEVEYRACTGLLDLPVNTTVGIAPTGGDVIAEFPFELETDGSYVVTASGIVANEDTPFGLLASGLEQTAQDDDSFALKVLHGVTDAPAVDIYANGSLLVENLAFGNYAGYLQVPAADYTIDVTAHGSSAAVASFSAPLAGLGGGTGVVYASGFLAPTETDSAFTLILATPSGYTVELPATDAAIVQTAQVQIIHNSPYPTVDIYINGSVALTEIGYRACTGLVDLPVSTTVGIAPTGGDVIAEFPFELATDGSYVVTASGIVGNEDSPFNLLASTLDQAAQDDDSFALKILHGVTDAPAVDIYANGALLVDSLTYGDYAGYYYVPAADYTIDVTAHGSSAAVASFSAPLAGLGGGAGVVYASGFLAPTETDSAFTLILATPSGYTVELPAAETALASDNNYENIPTNFTLNQNYPNPFNPSTTISFSLNKSGYVEVEIRDINGKFVKSLMNGFQNAGQAKLNWDGTNNLGRYVSAGVYLYSVKIDENIKTKKMIYLK
jgi:hypothetical protein